MENITIEKTNNGPYIVKADTERFGKQEIMFEGYSETECVRYILRTAAALYRVIHDKRYIAILVDWMDEDKMEKLTAACKRNFYLTSFYGLEHTRTYESVTGGVYVKMEGTANHSHVRQK